MAREIEFRIVDLVRNALGASLGVTPDWLIRPGRSECGSAWNVVRHIYGSLTDLELPTEMRSVERRTVDAVLVVGPQMRILEVDEKQHFNLFRAETLRCYPKASEVAFDVHEWLQLSVAKKKLEKSGWAKPMPPLFPGLNGRHKQRAFRDALCDLLPPIHGFAPTLRINDLETKSWIWQSNAAARMETLLQGRLRRAV